MTSVLIIIFRTFRWMMCVYSKQIECCYNVKELQMCIHACKTWKNISKTAVNYIIKGGCWRTEAPEMFTVKQQQSRGRSGSCAHSALRSTEKHEDSRSTTPCSRARAPQPSHTSPAPPPCCLAWRTGTGSGSTPLGCHSCSPERETTCSRRLPNTLLRTCRGTHIIIFSS